MRKPHRKQLLAWLLTAALLLINLPVSVLSEEIAENPNSYTGIYVRKFLERDK